MRPFTPARPTPSVAAQTVFFTAAGLVMLGNYYVYDAVGPVAELLHSQLHFSDTQIGTLNAIYSLPNIFLVMVGGVLVDRFTARVMVLVTTVICLFGAILTALGTHFPVMAAGRLLFGIGAETLVVAVLVALYQWFSPGRHFALQMQCRSHASISHSAARRFTRIAIRRGIRLAMPLTLGIGCFAPRMPMECVSTTSKARGRLSSRSSCAQGRWHRSLRIPSISTATLRH